MDENAYLKITIMIVGATISGHSEERFCLLKYHNVLHTFLLNTKYRPSIHHHMQQPIPQVPANDIDNRVLLCSVAR